MHIIYFVSLLSIFSLFSSCLPQTTDDKQATDSIGGVTDIQGGSGHSSPINNAAVNLNFSCTLSSHTKDYGKACNLDAPGTIFIADGKNLISETCPEISIYPEERKTTVIYGSTAAEVLKFGKDAIKGAAVPNWNQFSIQTLGITIEPGKVYPVTGVGYDEPTPPAVIGLIIGQGTQKIYGDIRGGVISYNNSPQIDSVTEAKFAIQTSQGTIIKGCIRANVRHHIKNANPIF